MLLPGRVPREGVEAPTALRDSAAGWTGKWGQHPNARGRAPLVASAPWASLLSPCTRLAAKASNPRPPPSGPPRAARGTRPVMSSLPPKANCKTPRAAACPTRQSASPGSPVLAGPKGSSTASCTNLINARTRWASASVSSANTPCGTRSCRARPNGLGLQASERAAADAARCDGSNGPRALNTGHPAAFPLRQRERRPRLVR